MTKTCLVLHHIGVRDKEILDFYKLALCHMIRRNVSTGHWRCCAVVTYNEEDLQDAALSLEMVELISFRAIKVPNAGTDIAPFLEILLRHVEVWGKADLILKSHTKTKLEWGYRLLGALFDWSFLDKILVDKSMMCGLKCYVLPFESGLTETTAMQHQSFFEEDMRLMRVGGDATFVAGTIFAARASFLKRVVDSKLLRCLLLASLRFLHQSERGYVSDCAGTRFTVTHSLERVLGLLVSLLGGVIAELPERVWDLYGCEALGMRTWRGVWEEYEKVYVEKSDLVSSVPEFFVRRGFTLGHRLNSEAAFSQTSLFA